MPKKKTKTDQFADLTWDDLDDWAGSKIVSRGKNYQRKGSVHDLAVTDDDGMIARVDGTQRYAAKVVMDEYGLPDSICACPYEWDCKHGVAVVIECLKRIEDNRPVTKASRDDARLKLLEDENGEDESIDKATCFSGPRRRRHDAAPAALHLCAVHEFRFPERSPGSHGMEPGD